MNDVPEEEISIKQVFLNLKEWFDYLLSKWFILVVAGLLGGAIGYTYAFFQKVTYTASLSFALEEESASTGGGISSLASQFGFDLGSSAGGAFSGSNLYELMKSRTIIEKALSNPVTVNGRKTSITQFYIELNKMNENWSKNPLLSNLNFMPQEEPVHPSLQRDSIMGIIYQGIINNNLNISQKDKKSTITTIDVRSQNEIFSKVFVEALAKEVSSFYIESKSKKAKRNVDILERETDSIRAELNSAISGVAEASDKTFNLNPALNVQRVQSSKRQIDVQANTAILTELVKNLELAKVTLLKETPLIQIIDRPVFPLKKEKASKLKTMLTMGFFAGFLMVFYLIAKRWWRKSIIPSSL